MTTRATANWPGSSGCLLRLLDEVSLSALGSGCAVSGVVLRLVSLTTGPSVIPEQRVKTQNRRLCHQTASTLLKLADGTQHGASSEATHQKPIAESAQRCHVTDRWGGNLLATPTHPHPFWSHSEHCWELTVGEGPSVHRGSVPCAFLLHAKRGHVFKCI